MSCVFCKEPKNWQGGERECAFDDQGRFISHNWNCGTMNRLRDIVDGDSGAHRPRWNDDQYIGEPLVIDDWDFDAEEGEPRGFFLVLSWYKRRGRTETAVVICDEGHTRPLRLREALHVIKKHTGEVAA